MVERSVSKPGGLMSGKRGLVMGVANDHSIAWGIARTLAANGAELAFTYQARHRESACVRCGKHRLTAGLAL